MAMLLDGLLNRGKEIVLASFCKEEGDEEGIRKILDAMSRGKDSRIRILCYDGTNARELTEAIAESGSVIATRFHASILAMAAGRSVLPVIYSDKTKHVLQDMGFAGTVYDLREDISWTDFAPTLAVAPAGADGHFEKLDAILK